MPESDQTTIPAAAWPQFRYDHQNRAASPLTGRYQGDLAWQVPTGKGIFSSPVIDAAGRIYIGSADQVFRCLNPDGGLAWEYPTEGIIDSAAALLEPDAVSPHPGVVFISGDGLMRRLALPEGEPPQLLWSFRAQPQPGLSFNTWWEGNVAAGPDGCLYAGNTNFLYYAVNPDGSQRWQYATGSNAWSMAAFGADGRIFWGSNDTFIRAVDPAGKELWRTRTLGFIAASAAIGGDGTVYIGSFDSNLYALDPQTGKTRWRFPTQEHIYSSAAIELDQAGQTRTIYFGSTDGSLYAVDPDGKLRWSFDTGAPLRSSPVLGRLEDGRLAVYFGSGNGKLYCLHSDGSLRWSYDTTPDDPHLRLRNDLNGSPALGPGGVVIGGEHGRIVYVPYDYPLHHPEDTRGSTAGQELPADFCGLMAVDQGANLHPGLPETLPASTLLAFKLVVRQGGRSIPGYVWNSPLPAPRDALQVQADPDFPMEVQHSADGRYVYILPKGFLTPSQTYRLTLSGRIYTGGWRIGNLTLGGKQYGNFSSTFSFQTAAIEHSGFPLRAEPGTVPAVEWTRLTAAIPPMLPSLNQIGFDDIEWLLCEVARTPADENGRGQVLFWVCGARRDASGALIPDPASDYRLPLSGMYWGENYILQNRRFRMAITGITVPFNRFELRGQITPDGSMPATAWAYADAQALSIPNFGPKLVIAGLANNIYQKLLVLGSYLTRPLPDGYPANRPIPGLRLRQLDVRAPHNGQAGYAEALFLSDAEAPVLASGHSPAIVVYDEALQPLPLDFHYLLQTIQNESGQLTGVRLTLPPDTHLPAQARVCVLVDACPIADESLANLLLTQL